MKALMKEALHVLLIKMYVATASVWVGVMLIGLLKRDGVWTVVMLQEIAPIVLGVCGIAFIHWFVLYRKEIKDDEKR